MLQAQRLSIVSIPLALAIAAGLVPAIAQQEAPSSAETATDANNPTENNPTENNPVETAVSSDETNENFPRYNSPGFMGGPVTRRVAFGFPLIKFVMVFASFLVWLRLLRLCAEDADRYELEVGSRVKVILVVGLTAIAAAIFLKAYGIGIAATVISSGGLFRSYARWRNPQVGESVTHLGWRHLFINPYASTAKSPNAEVKLSPSLASDSFSGTITLVGKTISNRNLRQPKDNDHPHSTGFQNAVALIGMAVSRRATDLHIGTKDNQVTLRLRVDGQLVKLDPLPIEAGRPMINVFKVLGDLSIAEKRRSQDGSFRADVDGRRLCFRVSSQGTNTGEKLSIRILDPAVNFSTFSALGVPPEAEARLVNTLSRSNGLILFVGPTGAGKSTTAYAALRHLDSGDRNIVTVEDPIEYSIPTIDQIEVKSRAGQTFEAALRSLLRQDADIVLIGEIRDEISARTACQTATTGQLVLSTLHATDSIAAIFRMMDLGVDRHNVAASIRTVVSQRLIRRLCTSCRVAYRPEESERQSSGLSDFQGELFTCPDPQTNNCAHCNGRGFLGRIGVFELLEATSRIRDLLREGAGASAVLAVARENSMSTLFDEGMRHVREGVISLQELHRTIDDP